MTVAKGKYRLYLVDSFTEEKNFQDIYLRLLTFVLDALSTSQSSKEMSTSPQLSETQGQGGS